MIQLNNSEIRDSETRSSASPSAVADRVTDLLAAQAARFQEALTRGLADVSQVRGDAAEAELAFAPVLRALDELNEAAGACLANLREAGSPLDRLRQLSGG